MNFSGINYESFADGEGVRVSFFVSGCRRHCRGCFNEDAQNFNYGTQFDDDALNNILEHLKKPYISGITILGGEPMEPENIPMVQLVVSAARDAGKTVWLYSGFTYEEIANDVSKASLLRLCDVLVDGPFVQEQRDITLGFRGSRNQRIIDIQKSITAGQVVLYEFMP